MPEHDLLSETQQEDPETWALCPAPSVTFKVTLQGNDLTASCPVGCDAWECYKRIPEVCGLFAEFWSALEWSSVGFYKRIPEVCGLFAEFWSALEWSSVGFFFLCSVYLSP